MVSPEASDSYGEAGRVLMADIASTAIERHPDESRILIWSRWNPLVERTLDLIYKRLSGKGLAPTWPPGRHGIDVARKRPSMDRVVTGASHDRQVIGARFSMALFDMDFIAHRDDAALLRCVILGRMVSGSVHTGGATNPYLSGRVFFFNQPFPAEPWGPASSSR